MSQPAKKFLLILYKTLAPADLSLLPRPIRLTIIALALALFFGLGIAHMINPDYFINRSGVRKGGEMLTAWNRISFRVVGAILVGGIIYVVYEFVSGAL